MKLTEEQRLKLENIHLKKILLEKEVQDIQSRFGNLQSEWEKILKESGIEDLSKAKVNLATGEVEEK